MYLRMSVITPDNVQVRGVKMRRMTIGAVSECEETDTSGEPVTREAVLMDDIKIVDYTTGRLNTAYAGDSSNAGDGLNVKMMPHINAGSGNAEG